MKPSRREIVKLGRALRVARKKQPLTDTELGLLTGIHPSQVGRICRGEFRTISHNVMLVCGALGVGSTAEAGAKEQSDAAWALLERSLRRLWDHTPERARRIARLLDAVLELQSHQ